jgi:hypothetical protein
MATVAVLSSEIGKGELRATIQGGDFHESVTNNLNIITNLSHGSYLEMLPKALSVSP